MLKALSVTFLILGWLALLNLPMPKEFENSKQFYASLLFFALGSIFTFLSCIK